MSKKGVRKIWKVPKIENELLYKFRRISKSSTNIIIKMTRTNTFAIIATLLAVSAVQTRMFDLNSAVVPIDRKVDLTRYAGSWYEIARYRQPYSGSCVCSVAQYTLAGNKVKVHNYCTESDGKQRSIDGYAISKNTDNTKLEVFFPTNQRGAPYWILDLGTSQNYGYVLIGDGQRRGLYILARTKTLDADVYAGIIKKAQDLGYNTAKLVKDDTSRCKIENIPATIPDFDPVSDIADLTGAVVPANTQVDLAKYIGTWYEIAAIPQPYLGNCVCSIAQYSLEGKKVKVLNTCANKQYKKRSTPGYAVSRNSLNTKLEVFFYGHGAPYWILAIGNGPTYDHVLVGEPKRTSLYILSRKTTLDQATYDKLVAVAKSEGFDTSKLVRDQVQYCVKKTESF